MNADNLLQKKKTSQVVSNIIKFQCYLCHHPSQMLRHCRATTDAEHMSRPKTPVRNRQQLFQCKGCNLRSSSTNTDNEILLERAAFLVKNVKAKVVLEGGRKKNIYIFLQKDFIQEKSHTL